MSDQSSQTNDQSSQTNDQSSQTNDNRPVWWRRASAAFESHGLGEYNPPRFSDGTVVHEVVRELQSELGVRVDFVGVGSAGNDEWFLRVDGVCVAEVCHERRVGGQTVYGLAPERFERLVREAVETETDGHRGIPPRSEDRL